MGNIQVSITAVRQYFVGQMSGDYRVHENAIPHRDNTNYRNLYTLFYWTYLSRSLHLAIFTEIVNLTDLELIVM